MSEAFAASVRALQLPDDTALVKAMGRGELEARVREYARAEAVAPADLSKEIHHSDEARDYTPGRARRPATPATNRWPSPPPRWPPLPP